MKARNNNQPLLTARNLRVDMLTENGALKIIRDVSFDLHSGETLGIVGESGSGKTVTCLSLLKLLPSPPALYRQGEVLFGEGDLWKASSQRLQKIRGRRISVIFQEAMSALNPVVKVGQQVAEVLSYHLQLNGNQARREVGRLFERVGIPDPEKRFHQYPHQLSGGLQQRVMIAVALACRPEILIADEPTTALDVTIQVQILELLKELQQQTNMGLIFISHDLGVIAEICQRVLVMYAGQIVESGTIEQIFDSPQHPYTQMLLQTIPDIKKARGSFSPIPGQIPAPGQLPSGCKFHPRCREAKPFCQQMEPPHFEVTAGQSIRCWERMPEEDKEKYRQ